MTRNLCAHPAQLLKPIISKLCYSFYMVIITLYNSEILLSLHYFLAPQFQTFTNLLIGILGVSNLTFFFFFEVGRNYASIIVNIISNNTVLQCFLLWIFLSIRRFLQLIVCIGVSTLSPPPTSKTSSFLFFFFAKPPLKSANYPSPPFQAIHSPKKTNCFFMHPPPLLKIGFFSNIKIIILKFFIINPIPSFKSN